MSVIYKAQTPALRKPLSIGEGRQGHSWLWHKEEWRKGHDRCTHRVLQCSKGNNLFLLRESWEAFWRRWHFLWTWNLKVGFQANILEDCHEQKTSVLDGISHLEFSPLYERETRHSLYCRHRFPHLMGDSSGPMTSTTRTETDGTSQEPGSTLTWIVGEGSVWPLNTWLMFMLQTVHMVTSYYQE